MQYSSWEWKVHHASFLQCGRNSWLQCGSVNMGGEGLAFPLALAMLAFAMGLVGSLASSLGPCSMTMGSSPRIVREAKRVLDLVIGRRVRLALRGVVVFLLIELPGDEVSVIFLEIWARVLPGMFAGCDEDMNSETVCCFLETVIYSNTRLCEPLV